VNNLQGQCLTSTVQVKAVFVQSSLSCGKAVVQGCASPARASQPLHHRSCPPLPIVSRGLLLCLPSHAAGLAHGCCLCAGAASPGLKKAPVSRPIPAAALVMLACGLARTRPDAALTGSSLRSASLTLADGSRLNLTPNPRDQPGAFQALVTFWCRSQINRQLPTAPTQGGYTTPFPPCLIF
jgi:hypothetical protein